MATRRTSTDVLRAGGTSGRLVVPTEARFDPIVIRRLAGERVSTGVSVPVRPTISPPGAPDVEEGTDRPASAPIPSAAPERVDPGVIRGVEDDAMGPAAELSALRDRASSLRGALAVARRIRDDEPVKAAMAARLAELRRIPDTLPDVSPKEVAVRAVGSAGGGDPVPLPGLTVAVLMDGDEVGRAGTDALGVARIALSERAAQAGAYEVRVLGPDEEPVSRARGRGGEGGAHLLTIPSSPALSRSFKAGLGFRKGLAAAEAEAKRLTEELNKELEAREVRLVKSIERVRAGIGDVLGGGTR